MLAGATWVRPSGIARTAFSGTPTVCTVSCRASVSGAPAMQAVVSTNVGSSTASCLTVTRWTSTAGAYLTRITEPAGFRWASSPPSYAATTSCGAAMRSSRGHRGLPRTAGAGVRTGRVAGPRRGGP